MWVGIIVIFPILFENAVKVVFIQNQDMIETLFTNRSYPGCCKYSIQGNSGGPGGPLDACLRIRTRGLFSAIDEQVGEKGKKAVYHV